MRYLSITLLFSSSMLLSGCETTSVYAPVVDISSIEHLPKNGIYIVQRNDTVYSIAWRYGLDYRFIAKVNNITPPYAIHVGQSIRLRRFATAVTKARPFPSSTPVISTPLPTVEREPMAPMSVWRWPARGALIGTFAGLNKGINIAGKLNTPIYAAGSGKIVYSGNGLRSYGNLIIIKHNNVFLSAYAHNNVVLVKEGEWVQSGQKIAEMGSTGSQKIMLHFEIRKEGKPVNPLNYLSK